MHTGATGAKVLGAERSPAHTGAARARVLGTERTSRAHGRGQSEGAGCGETLQRTRERPKRRRWVRKEPPLHTGATGARVLGAERTSSAHGSGRSEGAGCGETPPEHTGATKAKVLGAERASSAHGSDRSEGAGG